MHSPVNILAVNEITRDRLAEARTARLAREGEAAAPKRGSFRFQGVKLLRRVRLA